MAFKVFVTEVQQKTAESPYRVITPPYGVWKKPDLTLQIILHLKAVFGRTLAETNT